MRWCWMKAANDMKLIAYQCQVMEFDFPLNEWTRSLLIRNWWRSRGGRYNGWQRRQRCRWCGSLVGCWCGHPSQMRRSKVQNGLLFSIASTTDSQSRLLLPRSLSWQIDRFAMTVIVMRSWHRQTPFLDLYLLKARHGGDHLCFIIVLK